MRETVFALLSNEALVSALIGWLVAALLKFFIILITSRRLDWERLLGPGGMPSTHTTPIVACTTSIGLVAGVNTPLFALALVITIVVAYDAAGVRRHAGEQARAINSLIEDLTTFGPFKGQNIQDFFRRWDINKLKTLLGHNPVEVFAGVVLGILIAIIVHSQYIHLMLR